MLTSPQTSMMRNFAVFAVAVFFVILCKLRYHLEVPVCSVKIDDPGQLCIIQDMFLLHKFIYDMNCQSIHDTMQNKNIQNELNITVVTWTKAINSRYFLKKACWPPAWKLLPSALSDRPGLDIIYAGGKGQEKPQRIYNNDFTLWDCSTY